MSVVCQGCYLVLHRFSGLFHKDHSTQSGRYLSNNLQFFERFFVAHREIEAIYQLLTGRF